MTQFITHNQAGEPRRDAVDVTTRVELKRAFEVTLPLDIAILNERLYDIGIWLMERHISHLAHVLWQPQHEQIRLSFHRADDARAFRERFNAPLH